MENLRLQNRTDVSQEHHLLTTYLHQCFPYNIGQMICTIAVYKTNNGTGYQINRSNLCCHDYHPYRMRMHKRDPYDHAMHCIHIVEDERMEGK